MAITTQDGLLAAAKQYVSFAKTVSRTAVSTGWYTLLDLAGNPGAGTLAAGNTTTGIVPTDATPGYPSIAAFGGGSTGYLAQVDFGSSVACRMKIVDEVYKVGAFAYNSGTTALTGQPSYSGRMPGGDYGDTQIWIEVTTAFTGNNFQVQVTYTNQAGTTGQSSVILPATTAANLTLGRTYQLALAAGDTGVQAIESVICTTGSASAGAINVVVRRPLWSGRVRSVNDGDIHDWAKTGFPEVFADSALAVLIAADSTATGIPEVEFVIANA